MLLWFLLGAFLLLVGLYTLHVLRVAADERRLAACVDDERLEHESQDP